MLREFVIKGFKSLKDVKLNLSKITVIIGPNRAGKSSVLQALMMLRQSVGTQTLVTRGKYLTLGTFDEILSKGVEEMEFQIIGDTYLKSVRKLFPLSLGKINFGYHLKFREGQLTWHYCGIRIGKWQIIFESDLEKSESIVKPEQLTHELFRLSLSPGGLIGNILNVSIDKIVEESIRSDVSALKRDLEGVIVNVLSKIYHVPALRGIDKISYDLKGYREDIIASSEGASMFASHTADVLAYNRQLEEKLNKWCSEITGATVYVNLIPRDKVSILSKDIDVNILNEGFGVNQLLPMLLQLLLCPTGSIIGIEEPEIHLHPRSQAKLVDVLVDIVKKENKQLIITTHSEHILLRFLMAVAKKLIKPEDLSVYYFNKNRWTKAERLSVNKYGQIEEGLKGFFEFEIGQLEEYVDALRKFRMV